MKKEIFIVKGILRLIMKMNLKMFLFFVNFNKEENIYYEKERRLIGFESPPPLNRYEIEKDERYNSSDKHNSKSFL